MGSQGFRGCHGYCAVTPVALAIAEYDRVGRGEGGDCETEIHRLYKARLNTVTVCVHADNIDDNDNGDGDDEDDG